MEKMRKIGVIMGFTIPGDQKPPAVVEIHLEVTLPERMLRELAGPEADLDNFVLKARDFAEGRALLDLVEPEQAYQLIATTGETLKAKIDKVIPGLAEEFPFPSFQTMIDVFLLTNSAEDAAEMICKTDFGILSREATVRALIWRKGFLLGVLSAGGNAQNAPESVGPLMAAAFEAIAAQEKSRQEGRGH